MLNFSSNSASAGLFRGGSSRLPHWQPTLKGGYLQTRTGMEAASGAPDSDNPHGARRGSRALLALLPAWWQPASASGASLRLGPPGVQRTRPCPWPLRNISPEAPTAVGTGKGSALPVRLGVAGCRQWRQTVASGGGSASPAAGRQPPGRARDAHWHRRGRTQRGSLPVACRVSLTGCTSSLMRIY
jgi:hypothetical protein